jgi:hypothetical protein
LVAIWEFYLRKYISLNCLHEILQMNIWSYSGQKLLHSIDTGHTANIFCTKFIPETSDDLVASGAGDAEVMIHFIFLATNAILSS